MITQLISFAGAQTGPFARCLAQYCTVVLAVEPGERVSTDISGRTRLRLLPSGVFFPTVENLLPAQTRFSMEDWEKDSRALAEAMVDTAHVLSLTPAEAIEKGYCDGVAESVEEVAEALSGGDPYVIEDMKLTAVEKVAHFMMNPLLQAIFLIMILGGIYIEFKTPGIGLPLVIAIVGAVLYFSPLYIESVARYWEILLFLAGLVLLGLELFVIPGFGVCGISGIVCILVSLVFAAVDNAELLRFDGTLDLKPVVVPVSIVVCSACAAVAGGLFLVRKLYPTKAFDSVALRESLAPEDGCVGVRTGLESLVGEEVEVVTDLKPAGKVKTASGKVVEATLDHGYAARGTVVKVEKAEQGRLYVRR